MLLDQRLRRGEEEDLAAFAAQDLGDDHRCDDGLPHAGREDDQRGPLEARAGDVHLIRAFLDRPAAEQLVRDRHVFETSGTANNPLPQVRGRRRRRATTATTRTAIAATTRPTPRRRSTERLVETTTWNVAAALAVGSSSAVAVIVAG